MADREVGRVKRWKKWKWRGEVGAGKDEFEQFFERRAVVEVRFAASPTWDEPARIATWSVGAECVPRRKPLFQEHFLERYADDQCLSSR